MMNLLQVQDDLKNFSEEQLVKEMQQPTGSTPQFLVLSELNRRKRVKGDFEARQAQQQPTVAQDVVASAGVPQQGMMGMSESMAPQSTMSGGIGSMMPKTMKMGGEVDSYAEGGLIEGIADSVSQNAEALQSIQEATAQNAKMLQDRPTTPATQPTQQPTPPLSPIATIMPTRPFPFRPNRSIGFGGKGGPRTPQREPRNRFGVMPTQQIGSMASRLGRGGLGFGQYASRAFGIPEPQSMAEGGVIRAQDGLPDEESYLSKFGSAFGNFLLGRDQSKEEIEGRIKESNPLGFSPVLRSDATDATLEKMEEQEKPETTEEKKEDADAIIKSEADKSVKEVSATPKTLTLEEELAKRQAGLDKDRNFDKYMALAQAGLGILASDKPTLAQAVGEGGMKGLDAFNEANKRYEEGLTDILNARVKLKAAKKSGLTQKDAISAINGIDANIARLEKGSETFQYDDAKMKEIRGKIAQLESQKETLLPLAGFSRLSRNVSDSANTKS